MAKKSKESKTIDVEYTVTSAMHELEEILNTVTSKLEQKRKEIEKKGLDETVKDTVDKIKVGSEAIVDDVKEDAKKLKKNVDEMLKDL